MHAADGFAAPLAMCGTVLRCCVKVKIAHFTDMSSHVKYHSITVLVTYRMSKDY